MCHAIWLIGTGKAENAVELTRTLQDVKNQQDGGMSKLEAKGGRERGQCVTFNGDRPVASERKPFPQLTAEMPTYWVTSRQDLGKYGPLRFELSCGESHNFMITFKLLSATNPSSRRHTTSH